MAYWRSFFKRLGRATGHPLYTHIRRWVFHRLNDGNMLTPEWYLSYHWVLQHEGVNDGVVAVEITRRRM